MGQYLTLARGQKADNAVLADACEAIIGAMYLDAGMLPAADFIKAHWGALIRDDILPPKDSKTALQEWAQGRGLPLPSYRVIESSGPAHAPSFIMVVSVQGYPEAQGNGKTKRLATTAAATALLATLPVTP